MAQDSPNPEFAAVGLLTRREIEARIAGPLLQAFIEQFGREPTLKAAEKVIASLARESGAMLAQLLGGNTMQHFADGTAFWGQGGALEYEVLEANSTRISLNVTRCKFAEMYDQLGMRDLGYLLSCGRDFAMIEGFNPKITLTRSRTIMQGDPFCDFRFELRDE
ncbi:MAG: L-2-amino-thiazoline-4-carboxylic acid hydrolase [Candidatus Abyssubacteria bacterium]